MNTASHKQALHQHAPWNEPPVAHLEVGFDHLSTVLLQEFEQSCILDASHLQDFSCAIAEVPSVARLQEGRVDEDGERRCIGAQLVLALVEVDGRFDAD